MSITHYKTLCENVHVYKLNGDFVVALHRNGRPVGRPTTYLPLRRSQIRSVAEWLNAEALCFPSLAFSHCYFKQPDGTFLSGRGSAQIGAFVSDLALFCEVNVLERLDAPGMPQVPTYAPGPHDAGPPPTVERLHALLEQPVPGGDRIGFVREFGFSDNETHKMFYLRTLKPYGGSFAWPTVEEEETPFKVFCSRPPAPTRLRSEFPHLQKLAATYPLDPISHSNYFGYLLACFGGHTINKPVPLLVIDSWGQGMGKSDLAGAIYSILENEHPSPLNYDPRQRSCDSLSAHLARDAKTLCLDNLSRVRDWDVAWLSTLCTNRVVNDRVRYDRETSSFYGCLVIVNMVFGDATLSQDLIARTWRVAIQGRRDYWARFENGFNPRVAHEYALAHRADLVAECYSAVKQTWGKTPAVSRKLVESSRFPEFLRTAAAAYELVFQREFLPDTGAHAGMLSSIAVQALKAEKVEFTSDGVHTRLSPMHAVKVKELVGGRALGYVIDSDGKPQKEDVSQWYPNP